MRAADVGDFSDHPQQNCDKASSTSHHFILYKLVKNHKKAHKLKELCAVITVINLPFAKTMRTYTSHSF